MAATSADNKTNQRMIIGGRRITMKANKMKTPSAGTQGILEPLIKTSTAYTILNTEISVKLDQADRPDPDIEALRDLSIKVVVNIPTPIINNIYHGDCVQVMKSFPPDFVDLIITSPPYFHNRIYGDETLGREEDPRDYINNIADVMLECKRVLKPTGSLYLNLGDGYFGTKGFSRRPGGRGARKTDVHYAQEHRIAKQDGRYLQHKQLLLLPSRIASRMQNDGWLLRNDLIWEKPNAFPTFSPDRRYPVYEHIFHFVKTKKYYFDYELAKELNNHRDVMRVSIEAFGEHQASFSKRLIRPLLLSTSQEGDIVMDPFAGSGTTCAVAKEYNRQYIGIELSEQFCRLAQKNIETTVSLQQGRLTLCSIAN